MLFEKIIFQFNRPPAHLNKNQELYFSYLNSGSSIFEMSNLLLKQGWLISFIDLIDLFKKVLTEDLFQHPNQKLSVQWLLSHQVQKEILTKKLAIDRSLTLSEISFLRNLKPEIRQVLLHGAIRKKVLPQQKVIVEGSVSRDLYAVTKGSFQIFRNQNFLAQIHPGACFGEAGFFFGSPRTATVQAEIDSEVLVIPWRNDFQNLMNQSIAQNLQVRFWIQHALSQSQLFKTLPTECFDFLSMIGKVLRLSPQQVLIHEGTIGTNAYLIVQGELTVSQAQKRIRQIKQGDFVGEVGLMKTGGKRTATVQSLTDSLVLEIPQSEFYSMLSQNIMIGHQLEQLANERLLADRTRLA